MDIFEIIERDHNKLRELGQQIMDTHDHQQRKEIFSQYRENLQSHERAEERFFYIALLADDKSQDEARHSIAEHDEIEELIESTDNDADTDMWTARFKELHELVTHHMEEEEEEIFRVAREVLSDRQKDDLAIRYDQMFSEHRIHH
jgi:hemerythrin superfamily protein